MICVYSFPHKTHYFDISCVSQWSRIQANFIHGWRGLLPLQLPLPVHPNFLAAMATPNVFLATPNHAGSWPKATDSNPIYCTLFFKGRLLASACFGCLSLAFKCVCVRSRVYRLYLQEGSPDKTSLCHYHKRRSWNPPVHFNFVSIFICIGNAYLRF